MKKELNYNEQRNNINGLRIEECIVCENNIITDGTITYCHACKNTIGISEYVVRVNHLGRMLHFEEMSKGIFAFIFEFSYDGQRHPSAHTMRNSSISPFLGVTLTCNINSISERPEISAVAVFKDKYEIEVEMSEDYVKLLLAKMISAISSNSSDNITFDYTNHFNEEDSFDKEDNYRDYLKANADMMNMNSSEKPKNETHTDSESANKSVKSDSFASSKLSLHDIARSMYSILQSGSDLFKDIDWDDIEDTAKNIMASEMQKDSEALVELLNCTLLSGDYKCSDKVKQKVSEIVNNAISACNKNSDSSTVKPEKKSTGTFNELVSILDDFSISFNQCKAIEYKDKPDIVDMIAVVNSNGKECLWIISNDGIYKVFDKVDNCRSWRIFGLPESSSLSFSNIDELANLLSNMVTIKPEFKCDEPNQDFHDSRLSCLPDIDCDFNTDENTANKIKTEINNVHSKHYDDNRVERVLSSAKLRVQCKKELKREQALKYINNLSDDDLLNELRKRMLSK